VSAGSPARVKLKLNRDAATAIRRGHPWVYRNGVQGSAPVGEVVDLGEAWGLFDEGPIAIRVLGRGPPQPLPRVIEGRIGRADRIRWRCIGTTTTCWRVVNGAGDGLPGVVVDRYGDVAVLRLYSKAWEPHLDLLVSTLATLPWVSTVFRRYGVMRVDGRHGGETIHGPAPAEVLVVQEHGIKLLVRPWAGQKTGLFLDQRENRRRIGELSAGRRVLNLFGYNGGFSIYAALGGAARVHTVDLSAPALEDAKEIFRLNDLPLKAHAFEVADVFEWEPPDRYDLVVCDPPSLARGKRSQKAAERSYGQLAARVAPAVSSKGLLATASCTARLTRSEWETAVSDGLSREGQWAWLEHASAPLDHPVAAGHPEGSYLKFALLTRI